MKKIFNKKELIWKYAILLFFLISYIFFFEAWKDLTSLFLFIFAYCFAILFMVFDEQYLYRFYQDQIEESGENVSHKFPFLASRSSLFILLLPALTIFVLTSTGSFLGIAFILAINLFLLIEMFQLRNEFLLFKDRFFRDLKRNLDRREVNYICLFALLYFFLLLFIWFF